MEEQSFEIMRDLQGYFKEGERKAIYNAADSNRDKVLIRLLWISGRRISEILDIKVHEIDFQSNMISFHISKKTKKAINELGEKVRVKKDLVKLKPIDDWTARFLKWYVWNEGLGTTDYLFKSNYREGRISRQRAFQIIRRCCEKAGIEMVGEKKPHPHHFRHTFAITAAKNMKTPSDVRKLQMIMEHSNLAVTEQYLQFSDEETRDIIENIGD